MACLVLPSETARLVYGYLVKEKLDDIALQFLENSPYLTDCYHIVKSGYQFNTKFLYKELHELIQEYSTIQNSVNKKVGLLSKSSSLYKNIKLQCDNLSEIIDMILFWRCDESECESPFTSVEENKKKNGTCQTEGGTDKINEMTVNNNTKNNNSNNSNNNNNSNSISNNNNNNISNINNNDDDDEDDNTNNNINNDILAQDSECNEYAGGSALGNDQVRGENEEIFEDSEYRLNSKYPDQTNANLNCMVENIDVEDVRNGMSNEVANTYNEMQGQKESEMGDVTKDNSEMDISNLDESTSDKSNKIEISLIQNDQDVVNVNGQIKIVRIEKDNHENEEKNQLSNAFVQHLDGMESALNMENGSVFYVSPDVGNITINQDKNQIIVIPIDFKAQNSCQTEGTNEQPQAQNIIGNGGNCIGTSSGIIFDDIPVASSSVPVSASSAMLPFNSTFVDENIVTENTYLKNKGLIYELENKVKPQIFPESTSVKVEPPPAPAPVQTILWSQVIEPADSRNRRILPKTIPSMQNTPVVVVQPLIKKNLVFRTGVKPELTRKREKRKRKKDAENLTNTNVGTNEEKSVTGLPSMRTSANEGPTENECAALAEESVKDVQTTESSEKVNEEKENLAMGEKTIETPVIVLNKNPKRLSLSTPRRRSHIRALEFETPPKSGNSKKKSRTSPKVKDEELKITNKNVRNTLFKSPDFDTVFKTPSCLKDGKKDSPDDDNSARETQDQTLALPLETTNLNAKPDESWNSVPGVCCLSKRSDKKTGPKKSWDADLRDFISSGISAPSDSIDAGENKRSRKVKKAQKNDKSTKKKPPSPKKSKAAQVIPSPSKISLTAKRNTYSISGNEEGSPVRSLLEELDLVTPFKDSEPVRDVEETPITKFLRENVNGLDIDLNMINTPIFPPTPSIVVTPDCDDSLPITGTYYYTPLKDSAKEKTAKVEESAKAVQDIETAESVRKKGAKETHEKVIGELVSKAKEIIGLKTADKEESTATKPLSGKVLSMVKIQMITQCDKKLCENIPINEEPIDVASEADKASEECANYDLKRELEEKRQRALKKIKSVKENFSDQSRRKKGKKSPVKRKMGDDAGKSRKRVKRMSANDSGGSDEKDLSTGSVKEAEIFHSTPVEDRSRSANRDDSNDRVDRSMLDEIRDEFPCFEDDGEFSELPLKTRKKLHYIKHFVKCEEIAKFLEHEKKTLKLKRSHRKFFQVFYKWLRHPHSREVNTSERTQTIFKEYRSVFEKIKTGVSLKLNDEESEKEDRRFSGIHGQFSDDDTDTKCKSNGKKKEEDTDDGPVSVLPLKKRKATVQPSQPKEAESGEKSHATENPSRTQTLLQDIDVDRFLSQIHGQENR